MHRSAAGTVMYEQIAVDKLILMLLVAKLANTK